LRGYTEEVFQERAGELEERLGYLDREHLSLLETVKSLSEKLGKEAVSGDALLRELEDLRSRYEDLSGGMKSFWPVSAGKLKMLVG